MTKKIVVTECISLDGVIDDPGGMEDFGNWTDPFSCGPECDWLKHESCWLAIALIFNSIAGGKQAESAATSSYSVTRQPDASAQSY